MIRSSGHIYQVKVEIYFMYLKHVEKSHVVVYSGDVRLILKNSFSNLDSKEFSPSKVPISDLRMEDALHKKFSIKDLLSKCDQIRSLLRICLHLLKKPLMENFIFCAVIVLTLLERD